MRRLVLPLVGLSLVLVSCSAGEADESGSVTTASPSLSTPPETTSGGETTSSHASTTTLAPHITDSGRPAAPDFTLELGEGGTYTLYEGAKPVYLVFWAEW